MRMADEQSGQTNIIIIVMPSNNIITLSFSRSRSHPVTLAACTNKTAAVSAAAEGCF